MGIAVAQPGRLTERQWPMLVGRGCASAEARFALIAERLVDAAGLRAGDAVLDVATGSGEAAIAAARRGCVVTGVDDVAALSERARERAAVEGLDVTFAVSHPDRVQLTLTAQPRAKVTVQVTYTPTGGNPNTKSKTLTLRSGRR